MDEKIAVVYRLLKYIGPADWIVATLKQGKVPANGPSFLGPNGPAIYSEILEEDPRKKTPEEGCS